MVNVKYNWTSFEKDAKHISKIVSETYPNVKTIYAIPKGGLVIGVKLAHLLGAFLYVDINRLVSDINKGKVELKNLLIVDDVSDTGNTLLKLNSLIDVNNCVVATLHTKTGTKFKPDISCKNYKRDEWIIYCWEKQQ